MTDNDKLVAFETAISLMLEAQERLSDAEKLFKKCGIELCDRFEWNDYTKEGDAYCNLLLFKGVKKFEELSGEQGYPRFSGSQRYVEHKGLRICQLGEGKTSTVTKYKYK